VTVGHNPPVPASPRCCIWLSGPGFQDLDIWLSRPGFQDLDKRTLGLALRTWVSGLQYLALRTWVSGPRQTHRYRTPKALHPTVVLSFSRHFSLRPPSLFSTSNGHRQTHRQATLYIRFAKKILPKFVKHTLIYMFEDVRHFCYSTKLGKKKTLGQE
jgi:hypothetical protein